MKITVSEALSFDTLSSDTLENDYVKSMDGFVQHGNISTLEHCVSVARTCFVLNRRLPLSFDESALVKSAILHDFYLYDWHVKSDANKLHGFRHPEIAAENARKLAGASVKEISAIKTHMWPLTITKIPKSREAWLLCLVDKYCALKETVKR